MATNSPNEEVQILISRAFSFHSKDRRGALRTVQRALNLAKERGFDESEDFMHYFRHVEMQSTRATHKWLMGLFEYVSADEICRLSELGGF